jgi:uncharacterized protein with PQ loop repeat
MEKFIYCLGMSASIALPFFNFPLMWRIYKRKSSQDISLVWAYGIFTSLLLMLPQALVSSDPVFKIFGILNFSFFCGVVLMVLWFRDRR